MGLARRCRLIKEYSVLRYLYLCWVCSKDVAKYVYLRYLYRYLRLINVSADTPVGWLARWLAYVKYLPSWGRLFLVAAAAQASFAWLHWCRNVLTRQADSSRRAPWERLHVTDLAGTIDSREPQAVLFHIQIPGNRISLLLHPNSTYSLAWAPSTGHFKSPSTVRLGILDSSIPTTFAPHDRDAKYRPPCIHAEDGYLIDTCLRSTTLDLKLTAADPPSLESVCMRVYAYLFYTYADIVCACACAYARG